MLTALPPEKQGLTLTMLTVWGCSLQGLTLAIPEMVPFRLTQNLVDAFGVSGYEGAYRRACEVTLQVRLQPLCPPAVMHITLVHFDFSMQDQVAHVARPS